MQAAGLNSHLQEARMKRSGENFRGSTAFFSGGYDKSDSENCLSQRATPAGGSTGHLKTARAARHTVRLRRGVTRSSIDSDSQDVLALLLEKMDKCIAFFIVANALIIGAQTDIQARNRTEKSPFFFTVVEFIFCLVFSTELILKLVAYRHHFFFMQGWHWNVFDTSLVGLQLMEVIAFLSSAGSGSADSGDSTIKLLRLLRVTRILRLARLFNQLGEFATIICMIVASWRAFFWDCMMLVCVIYMVAIVLTQIVLNRRLEMEAWGSDSDVELEKWWGSLWQSCLSLYMSTTGGVDWNDLCAPLTSDIHVLVTVAYALYIAFILLCMMNIITGTFVQTAFGGAEKLMERDFEQAARLLFVSMFDLDEDEDITSTITRPQYIELLENKEIRQRLQRIGVSEFDARLLFRLLDQSNHGEVEFDRLVSNIVRLHQGSKFMDVMKLMYVTEGQHGKFDCLSQQIETCTKSLECTLKKSSEKKDFKSFLQAKTNGITSTDTEMQKPLQAADIPAETLNCSDLKQTSLKQEDSNAKEDGIFRVSSPQKLTYIKDEEPLQPQLFFDIASSSSSPNRSQESRPGLISKSGSDVPELDSGMEKRHLLGIGEEVDRENPVFQEADSLQQWFHGLAHHGSGGEPTSVMNGNNIDDESGRPDTPLKSPKKRGKFKLIKKVKVPADENTDIVI